MKSSQYNFLLEKGEKVYCFNASSYKFFVLDKGYKSALDELFALPNFALDRFPHLKSLMLDGRFVVEENEDEVEYVRRKNHEAENQSSYKLIVLPTFACNFNCWYCVQNHKGDFMTEEVVRRVCEHVTYVIKEKHITSLNIEWFGGEPLLGFVKSMVPISAHAKKMCMESGIPYSSTITTNGYLIDKSMLKKMRELNFLGFQITLDGIREFHDKIRVAPSKSSFDIILERVNWICEVLEEASVKLRINYDDKNFDPDIFLEQIDKRIQQKYKPRIEFLLRKVWQIAGNDINKEKNIAFIQQAVAKGFRVSQSTFLNTNATRCYTCKRNFNTIAPDGNIYKCTARDDYSRNQSFGKIEKNGSIQWFHPDFEQLYFENHAYENPQCLACKYLPLCWGPCPKSLEENNLKPPSFKCQKALPNDLSFEEAILGYCIYNQ